MNVGDVLKVLRGMFLLGDLLNGAQAVLELQQGAEDAPVLRHALSVLLLLALARLLQVDDGGLLLGEHLEQSIGGTGLTVGGDVEWVGDELEHTEDLHAGEGEEGGQGRMGRRERRKEGRRANEEGVR